MKDIYIVSVGNHILGVYSTRELAEEVQTQYEYSEVEQYDLDKVPGKTYTEESRWWVK